VFKRGNTLVKMKLKIKPDSAVAFQVNKIIDRPPKEKVIYMVIAGERFLN